MQTQTQILTTVQFLKLINYQQVMKQKGIHVGRHGSEIKEKKKVNIIWFSNKKINTN